MEDRIPAAHLSAAERDLETPMTDAVEQTILANPAEEDVEVHRGLEVGEYDAIEQARVIDMDEDYR
jgi:hypothetical protein